jgi:hypothetical protein
VFFSFLSHTHFKYTAADTMVNTHTKILNIFIFIFYIMLLFITDVKEILIIISVFCILSFQICQDEEFWNAPQYHFDIPPPLDRPGNWERVIAVPPVECRTSFRMRFQSGTKTITRVQLPLIPAFALTVHKSQGLNKACNALRKGHEAACMYCDSMTLILMSPSCLLMMNLNLMDRSVNSTINYNNIIRL